MSDVKWTKKYDLKVDGRHFRVFVSEHEGAGFHASCLWYERGRMLKAPGQLGSVSFLLEQRHAATEVDAVKQLRDWADEKFGAGYTFTESEA
jgi:hypothetical protein